MADVQSRSHENPREDEEMNLEAALNIPKDGSKEPEDPGDPNDPYNWPEWHKLTTYVTICLFSFMANVNASNFTVATLALRQYFGIDATRAVYLTALNVLMFGMGNLIWIPMMRVTGKRPVYLVAILALILTNVWSAKAGTYSSLLVSRMASGVGASAADATVPSAVAEMWKYRERGARMMYFHIALASGIFLGPLINAYVVQEHGWRWSPAWIAIASGFVFVLAVFFIHETQYDHLRTSDRTRWLSRRPFYSYWSLHKGVTRDRPAQKAWQAMKDIFVIASFPPILFASVMVGVFVGWTIIIQISIAQMFLSPPYLWSLAGVGLLHLAGWIGALISLYFGGFAIDQLVARGDEKHEVNTTKPEKRLPALILPFSIAPVGLIVYGICLAQDTYWIGPAAGYAMHSFGFVSVSNIVVTYAVETYRPVAGEAMVILFIVRNVIAVFCSIYCFPWIQKDGLKAVFGTMAGLEWAFMLFGLPLYLFAPKVKILTAKYGPMKRVREQQERADEEQRKIIAASSRLGGGPNGDV